MMLTCGKPFWVVMTSGRWEGLAPPSATMPSAMTGPANINNPSSHTDRRTVTHRRLPPVIPEPMRCPGSLLQLRASLDTTRNSRGCG
ncbi:hypothetical protein M5585_15195 [Serratia ureilytica]